MRETLLKILETGENTPAVDWLKKVIAEQTADFQTRPFYYAFSGGSRHFDKRGTTSATDDQLAALDQAAPGFTVDRWDQFRLARVILLTVLAEQPKDTFLENLHALLSTADIRETQAIYSAYPILPHPEDLIESAVDGLRTNIVEIYDSIALDNPFPAAHFTEEQWNQMVLKALFIHRPLYRIKGIDDRPNPALTEAVVDLAHERWAAGRAINPEAWRCTVGNLNEAIESDLIKLIQSEDVRSIDLEAVALVAKNDPNSTLGQNEDTIALQFTAIEQGNLTWQTLGHHIEVNSQ